MAEWIDLLDPSEEELRSALPREIHATAMAQLLEPTRHDDEPRPRLEGHDHYVFGVFLIPVAVPEEDRVFYQEIDVVATRERVVTVRKTPEQGKACDLAAARKSIERTASTRAGMVVYAIVDVVAERFLDLVDEFNDEIDELEEGIDSWSPQKVRRRISELRHDLLHVRRTLAPTRDAIRSVVDHRIDVGEGPELLPREVEISFGDTYDKLLRALDGLELSRDLLASARDYHQSKIANDQNEVTKRLAAIGSILLVPTFIVGVYGQNFDHMPELHWHLGYLFSWAVIVAVTVAQIAYFRRRGWL